VEVSLAAFDATGVHHRLPETSLTTHDFPFARVNPRQACRIAVLNRYTALGVPVTESVR
jgi:hypothetical protein